MPTLSDINIEAIAPSIDSASKKLDKALSYLRFAKKAAKAITMWLLMSPTD